MPTGALFNVRPTGNVQVVEFTPEAHDLINLNASRQVLSSIIPPTGQPRYLLDLHNVEWGGSKFLAVIMDFNLQVLRRQGQLRICGLQPHMKEIFDLTRISTILHLHDSVDSALKSFN